MKKKILLSATGLLLLALCGFTYAGSRDVTVKEFFDSSGKAVYYPMIDSQEPQNIDLKKLSAESGAPETAKIGDVFLGKDGYEKIIAVAKDGSFVSELIVSDEEV